VSKDQEEQEPENALDEKLTREDMDEYIEVRAYNLLSSEDVQALTNTLITEVKRLRYIVDSIPDEVWEDMKTWESMKGVIE